VSLDAGLHKRATFSTLIGNQTLHEQQNYQHSHPTISLQLKFVVSQVKTSDCHRLSQTINYFKVGRKTPVQRIYPTYLLHSCVLLLSPSLYIDRGIDTSASSIDWIRHKKRFLIVC
jgi:hypothetical protein